MKKLIFVFLLVFISFGVFAQVGNSVMDYTGEDWVMWTREKKISYVCGYLTAMGNVMSYLEILEDRRDPKMQDIGLFMEYFYQWATYNVTVGDVYNGINNYYAAGGNWLQFPINEVILVLLKKEWWDSGK